MFITKKKILKHEKEGRVYVFKFDIESTTVYKVGVCETNRTIERFFEILRDFHKIYRYVPRAAILKFKKFTNPYLVEKHLHELLDDCKYTFDKKFNGSSEFFVDVDIDAFLKYVDEFTYNELLQCTSLSIEEYEAICKELDPPTLTDDDIPF